MAQQVKLRRSSVAGNKPTTAQLELGELAINTNDGKLYFEKSSSLGESVQELIVTDAWNTGSVNISGSITVSGSIIANSFTGSFLGTSSYANSALTASYTLTASYFSGSVPLATTASYSITASYALAVSGSGVVGNISGNATNITAFTIDQDLGVSNQVSFGGVTSSFLGNLTGTASYAIQALSSSFATTAISASYFSGSVSNAISSSYAVTASYALLAATASYFSGSLFAPGSTTQVLYNNGGTIDGASGLVYSGSNVGIGTTSPSDILDVQKNQNGTTQFYFRNTDTTNASSRAYLNVIAGTNRISLYSLNADNNYFNTAYGNLHFQMNASTSVITPMFISSSGNVGIGTTNPADKLYILSSGFNVSTFDSSYGQMAISFANSGTIFAQLGSGNSVTPTGAANDLGLGTAGLANNIVFATGTSYLERMRITSAGDVGIGTSSPSGKLNVAAAGGDGSAILRISGTASDIFNWASSTMYANLTAGETVIHQIGKAESQYNAGHYGYRHISDGSSSNMLTMGMFQNDYLVNILGNGNVGIGTTSPNRQFIVAGTGQVGLYGTSAGIVFTNAGKTFDIDSAANFSINETGVLTALYIKAGGNIGVGTTDPTYKLHTYGSNPRNYIQDSSTGYALTQFTNNGGDFYIGVDNSAGSGFSGGSYARTLYGGGAYPMTFWTNGVLRVIIASDGNVGIGLTSPQKPLDVFSNANDFVTVGANNLSVGQWAGVHFGYRENNNNYRKSAIVFERTDLTSNNAQGKVHILNGPQAGAGSATLADAKLTINEAGNVGIGTTSPATKLQVNGTFASNALWTDATSVSYWGSYPTVYGGLTWDTGQATIFASSGNKLYLASNASSPSITIDTSGNVGVGTTSPGTKLQVVGGYVSTKDNTAYSGAFMEGVSGISYFGSLGSDDIQLYTGGATKVIIKQSTGNVGIGITNPGSLLQVGPGTSNSPSPVASLGGTASGILSALSLVNTTGNASAGYGTALDFHVNSVYSPTGRIATLAESTDTPAALAFYTYNSGLNEKMRITSAGNVGIGTTNPTYKLHTYGTNPRVFIQDSSTGFPILQLNNNSGNFYMSIDNSGGSAFGSAYGRYLYSEGAYPMIFVTNGAEQIRITSGGNVGIGTTSPGQKLQIEGSLLVNAGTSATAYRDIMLGGIGGWVTGESHGIDTVYNTASSPTTFSRIESYFDGTNGKIRFRNLYNDSNPRTDILMTIQGNGNVGIGTDNPGAKLDIVSTGAGSEGLRVDGATGGFAFVVKAGSDYTSHIRAGATVGVNYFTTPPSNGLIVEGNVGIGTTSPAAKLDIKGDLIVSSSLIVNQNTASLASGAQTISTNATSSYTAAFYNYTVASGSNARAGQVTAVWNGGSIQYTDVSTTDIGSTLGVAFTASLSGPNVQLTTVIPTSGWTVKTLVNLI